MSTLTNSAKFRPVVECVLQHGEGESVGQHARLFDKPGSTCRQRTQFECLLWQRPEVTALDSSLVKKKGACPATGMLWPALAPIHATQPMVGHDIYHVEANTR